MREIKRLCPNPFQTFCYTRSTTLISPEILKSVHYTNGLCGIESNRNTGNCCSIKGNLLRWQDPELQMKFVVYSRWWAGEVSLLEHPCAVTLLHVWHSALQILWPVFSIWSLRTVSSKAWEARWFWMHWRSQSTWSITYLLAPLLCVSPESFKLTLNQLLHAILLRI